MSHAALAQMQNRQLQIEQTGRKISVPNDSVGRLMYYLKCMTDVLGNCIPGHLTNFPNYYNLSYSDRQLVVQIAREYPPSKIPLFVEVDELPENSGNEFLKFSSLEETVTALGINSNGAAMMALRRQIETQQLLEVMAYTPGWARNNYYGPLLEIQQQQQRAAIAYSSRSSKKSSTCNLL